MMKNNLRRWFWALLLSLATPLAAAQDLSGLKQVVLSNANGEERVVIGHVFFDTAGEGRWKFDLRLDESRFTEHFLAMRPFKCLTGARQQLCHFPFGKERIITRDDLAPLEYSLMFLHKKPASVHVDSANGIYYQLAWGEKGLRGQLFDVDMDPIIVPQGDMRRPFRKEHLLQAHPGSHWLPRLSIE